MSQFDWPITKVNWNIHASQHRRFSGKIDASPLGPALFVRRGGLWAKHMGLKWGAIAHTLAQHIENLWNILGTWKEHVGNKWRMNKNSFPPAPSPKLKRKKIKAFSVHAEPSHWLHEISMFQNCSSSFLTRAITPPIINWGYLFIHVH